MARLDILGIYQQVAGHTPQTSLSNLFFSKNKNKITK